MQSPGCIYSALEKPITQHIGCEILKTKDPNCKQLQPPFPNALRGAHGRRGANWLFAYTGRPRTRLK
jgi:hypothetical protein